MVAMMTIVVVNIIGRMFGKAIIGTYEAVQLLIVVFVAFAIGYAAIKDAHVNMDIIVLRVSKPTQRVLAIISSIFTLGIWVLIAWFTLEFAGEQRLIGEHTIIMEWPIYPFRYIFALGAIVLCLVLLLVIIKTIKGNAK
jgi:TRAP-type C4-dicarboxylate transport system permease small subunit